MSKKNNWHARVQRQAIRRNGARLAPPPVPPQPYKQPVQSAKIAGAHAKALQIAQAAAKFVNGGGHLRHHRSGLPATAPTLYVNGRVEFAATVLAHLCAQAVRSGKAYRHHVHLQYRSLPFPAARLARHLPSMTIERARLSRPLMYTNRKAAMARRLAQICALSVLSGVAFSHHVTLVYSRYPHAARTLGMTCVAIDRLQGVQPAKKERKAPKNSHAMRKARVLATLAGDCARAVRAGTAYRHHVHLHYRSLPFPAARVARHAVRARTMRKALILRRLARECAAFVRMRYPLRHPHLVYRSLPYPSARVETVTMVPRRRFLILRSLAYAAAASVRNGRKLRHVNLVYRSLPYPRARVEQVTMVPRRRFLILRQIAYAAAMFVRMNHLNHVNLVYRSLPFPSARVEQVTMVPRRRFLILRSLAYAAAAFVNNGGKLRHPHLVYRSLPYPSARVETVTMVPRRKFLILRSLAYAAAAFVVFGGRLNHVNLVYRSLPYPRARVEPTSFITRSKFRALRALAHDAQRFLAKNKLRHIDLVYTSLPFAHARAVTFQPATQVYTRRVLALRKRHVLQILARQCAIAVRSGHAYRRHVTLFGQRYSSARRTLTETLQHLNRPPVARYVSQVARGPIREPMATVAPVFVPEAAKLARACAGAVRSGHPFENHIRLAYSYLPFHSAHAVSASKIGAAQPSIHVRRIIQSAMPYLA